MWVRVYLWLYLDSRDFTSVQVCTIQGRGPQVPGLKNSGIQHDNKLDDSLHLLQECVMHHCNLLFSCYCYMVVKLYGGLNWKAHTTKLKILLRHYWTQAGLESVCLFIFISHYEKEGSMWSREYTLKSFTMYLWC